MSEGTFELVIEKGVVTGCKGQSKVIDIPEGVTEIGAKAFKNCKIIEEVNVKSTVLKTIGEGAFEDCTNMKNCTLSSLKGSIENCAFKGCSALKYIEIPDGTIKIGKDAFSSCESILYVVIPSTVFVIDGELFDSDNKKTVILGEIGSEAEEYAKSNKMPFKENTPAIRKEFIALSNKKDNTGYKDFNVFGETIRCYKSVIVYQELLDFFKYLNSDFSKEVINSVTKDITVFNDKSENLINLTQVYAEKTRDFLQKYGVFISDTVFRTTTLKYEANYLEVCGAYIDVCNKCIEAIKEGKANLQSDLIAEAKSKVTGLSYGVIGDSLTMVAYAIDDYRARKRQINEAYDVAASKLKTGTNQIINQTQNIYANLLNDTLLPAFDKSVSYVCDGLMQLAIEEMLEAKVIDKKVFEIYDIGKSSKLIEQAKKNPNIDKKYAIATTLKLYPLNVEAVVLAINENLIDDDFLRYVDYYDLCKNDRVNLAFANKISHDIKKNLIDKELLHFINSYGFYKNDIVIIAFENKFSYLELVSFLEKYSDVLGDGFKKTIEASIKHKAKILIERINNDCDPMEIDIDTWNDLVQKYTIIDSKNVNRYKISENEVKAPNGRELLAQAIEMAKEEKRLSDERKHQEIQRKVQEEAARLKSLREERDAEERVAQLASQREKEKKKKKFIAKIIATIAFLLACIIAFFVIRDVAIPLSIYNNGVELLTNKQYVEAVNTLNSVYKTKDAEMKILEAETRILKQAKIGDTVIFGRNNIFETVLPIEWIVIDASDNNLLLLSKYALSMFLDGPDDSYFELKDRIKPTLEDLYDESFSSSEKYLIKPTNSPQFKGMRLFMLDDSEIDEYFPTEESRLLKPSEFIYGSGYSHIEDLEYYYKGYIPWLTVERENGYPCKVDYLGNYGTFDFLGIRPAIWVSLDNSNSVNN